MHHFPDVDGSHVLAVVLTGGGKTGYFYGYILLLKAFEKMLPPCTLLKQNLLQPDAGITRHPLGA